MEVECDKSNGIATFADLNNGDIFNTLGDFTDINNINIFMKIEINNQQSAAVDVRTGRVFTEGWSDMPVYKMSGVLTIR